MLSMHLHEQKNKDSDTMHNYILYHNRVYCSQMIKSLMISNIVQLCMHRQKFQLAMYDLIIMCISLVDIDTCICIYVHISIHYQKSNLP